MRTAQLTVVLASAVVITARADAQPAEGESLETAVAEAELQQQANSSDRSTTQVVVPTDVHVLSSVPVQREPARAPRRVDPLATTERWGGGLRLTGLSGIGALPGVNYGGEVAINVRRDETFAELAIARWVPEHSYTVTAMSSSHPLRLDVWTLRAGFASMTMPLRAWVLAEVGELASAPGMQAMPGVVTRMVTGETPGERRWKAFGGGLGVAWSASQQSRLVGSMEVAIPAGRDEIQLDAYGAYRPDPLTARFSVGFEVGWR